jgi:hypothetical protein
MQELYGELPLGSVIFAAADSAYFMEHGLPFCISSSKAGFDTHIHVTNPTQKVLSLAGIVNAVTDRAVTFTFDDADISALTGDQKRTYYACLRFNVLPTILDSAGRVMVLDIDCLVMKNFKFPTMQPCGYFPRPNESHEGMKVAAGAVYFTKGVMNIANGIRDTLAGLPLNWFADQIALSHVFKQVPEEHVAIFDNEFMDWEFVEGTAIWTGKGPRKYDNPTYVNKKIEFAQMGITKLRAAKTVLLKPRLDIPFKRFGLQIRSDAPLPEIRQHWANFADSVNCDLTIELPRWMFNSTIEGMLDPDVSLLVPHTEKPQWGGLIKNKTKFYMQTVFPWLFTIDRWGWGGGAAFLDTFKSDMMYTEEAFNTMRDYAIQGGTKFAQPKDSKAPRINSPTIFVPLQLPHDETILNHADITVPEFVEALCKWADADANRPDIIFKGHPANLQSMDPLIRIIQKYNRVSYTTNLNIHEVIPQVDAVYVINSGVGQEAMLHDAKVVAFGDAEYQDAVIEGNIDDLDFTWAMVEADDPVARANIYRRWYHWYITEITYNTRN